MCVCVYVCVLFTCESLDRFPLCFCVKSVGHEYDYVNGCIL